MSLILKLFKHSDGDTTFLAEHTFDAEFVTVGRGQACSLALEDPEKHLSRSQAEFVRTEEGYDLKILSKTSKTFLNRQELDPESRVTIREGDTVLMDIYELEIVSVGEEEADPEATMAFRGKNWSTPAPATPAIAASPHQSASLSESITIPGNGAQVARDANQLDVVILDVDPSPVAPPPHLPRPRGGGRFSRFAKPLAAGATLVVGVIAVVTLWPTLTQQQPAANAAKTSEQDVERLNSEIAALFKTIEKVQRDLKEGVSTANRDMENLAGKIRAVRPGPEHETLGTQLTEAKQAAQISAALERKFRERTDGPEGLQKVQGNMGAASAALKNGDKAMVSGLLGESVATLSLLQLSAGDDRKIAQAELQKGREETRVAMAAAKAEADGRAKDEAEKRAREAQARSKVESAAIAKAEREKEEAASRLRLEVAARARTDAEAKERSEERGRAEKERSEERARAEARAEAAEKRRAENEARARAEAQAARAEAQARAREEADRRAAMEVFQGFARMIR